MSPADETPGGTVQLRRNPPAGIGGPTAPDAQTHHTFAGAHLQGEQ